MAADYKKISMDGLWDNNPALVQLLGLCPLLAVTGTVVNAIGLGIASILVLLGSNLTVSAFRKFVPDSVRLPIFVMIIASFVTAIELLMKAFTYELYLILGIFIPLIVTNCAIMGRADAFACKNPVKESLLDGLMMGLGFTVVLVILGAMRELLGLGTLFSDMHLLFGPMAADWKITVVDDYTGFLFAVLPPGAFVGMGLLIALKNIIDARAKERLAQQTPDEGAKPERVRITG
ncbi:electron transport complex subunit E [Neptuniibacter sp. QD72_48]|uniref:electron transport complex subunit E n=1 Tax=unclassified Neptuniibacter TaxID=2630693 RepID=UPI0039F6BB08